MGTSSCKLTQKKCKPCERGAAPLSREEAETLLQHVPGWELTCNGRQLRRHWTGKNFVEAIKFFNRIAEVAEQEGHHPDLHLTDYRSITVELSTHAIGGLSENDFIVAAKIGRLPIELK